MSQVASISSRRRTRSAGPDAPGPLTVAIPAVDADAGLRDRLRSHLHPLERAGLLDATPSTDFATADLVLPIVSIDFLNAAASSGPAIDAAIARHRSRTARVIPIIARPCLWDATPFAGLQALPHHTRAISSLPSEEETLVDIVRAIRSAAEQMRARPQAG